MGLTAPVMLNPAIVRECLYIFVISKKNAITLDFQSVVRIKVKHWGSHPTARFLSSAGWWYDCTMQHVKLGMRTRMSLIPDESLYCGAAIGGIRF